MTSDTAGWIWLIVLILLAIGFLLATCVHWR